MTAIGDNMEFFALLRSLIDAWCDRHALKPLSRVLGPYLAFDGLTDGWGEILNALKRITNCLVSADDASFLAESRGPDAGERDRQHRAGRGELVAWTEFLAPVQIVVDRQSEGSAYSPMTLA